MILVTGGNGFIGRCVCSLLAGRGKEVVALDYRIPDKSIKDVTYRFEHCDIRDADHIDALFKKYSFLFWSF